MLYNRTRPIKKATQFEVEGMVSEPEMACYVPYLRLVTLSMSYSTAKSSKHNITTLRLWTMELNLLNVNESNHSLCVNAAGTDRDGEIAFKGYSGFTEQE